MISIQTNVNSLVAQQNLSVTSAFQSKTIAQLTSGYRINQSGDDAAGLAVANKFRSTVAELTQGVANGNDATAQLQIMDGGMSNISAILDRLKTLATQSASGTFTGDRTILNNEFQGDIGEIDRQAQSIGLDTGGTFAKNLQVYLGQGSGSATLSNAQVGVDLTASTVDAQSLGMKGMQAVAGAADLSATSATSVAKIVANATNKASEATSGSAEFYFSGSGFSDTGMIGVSVNLAGAADAQTLANAINAGIQNASAAATPQAAAFKAAGIVASVHTDAAGGQQIAFTSSTAAFQVQAGDQMSNAIMGNFSSGATGASLNTTVTGQTMAAGGTVLALPINITIRGGGLAAPEALTLTAGSVATMAAALTTQVANDANLKAAGITVAQVNGQLVFSSAQKSPFTVEADGDTTNALGLGAWSSGTTTGNLAVQGLAPALATTLTTNALAGGQAAFEFSVGGGATIGVAPIALSGGNAQAATLTSGTIAGLTNFQTGVNDTLNFDVDTHEVSVIFNPAGTGGTSTATAATFADPATTVVVAATSAAATSAGTPFAGGGSVTLTSVGGAETGSIALTGSAVNATVAGAVAAVDVSVTRTVVGGANTMKISVDGAATSTLTVAAAVYTNAALGTSTAAVQTGSIDLKTAPDVVVTGAGATSGQFSVTIDNGVSTEIDIAHGTYSAANLGNGGSNDLIAAIQTQLNAHNLDATASIDGGGHLNITSNNIRSNTRVTIGDYNFNHFDTNVLGLTEGSNTGSIVATDMVVGLNDALFTAGVAAKAVKVGSSVDITSNTKGANSTMSIWDGAAPGLLAAISLASGETQGSGHNTMQVSIDGGATKTITLASANYLAANAGSATSAATATTVNYFAANHLLAAGTLSVSVDGAAAVTVNVAGNMIGAGFIGANTGVTGDSTDYVKAVQDGLDNAHVNATASVTAGGTLIISSNSKGTVSTVSVGTSALATTLGLDAETHTGTESATDVVAAMNHALAGTGATASLNFAGQMVVTSNQLGGTGVNSEVRVLNDPSNPGLIGSLGLAAGAVGANVGSSSNTMMVSVDGGGPKLVTIAAGDYRGQDSGLGGAHDIVAAFTAGLASAGVAATASVIASGIGSGNLVLSSNTTGLVSKILIGAPPAQAGVTSATTALGLTPGTIHTGSDTSSIYVSLDGGAATKVTIADNASYTSANIVGAVNTGLTNAGLAATASVDLTGHLVITSNLTGNTSSVAVTDDAADPGLLTLLGMNGNTDAAGADGDTLDAIKTQINSAIGSAVSLVGTGAGATASVVGNTILIANNTGGLSHTLVMDATPGTAGAGVLGGITHVASTNRTGGDIATALQAEFNGNATLKAAGLTATYTGGTHLSITATSEFRMNAGAATALGTVLGTADITNGADFSGTPKTLTVALDGAAATTVTLNQNYTTAAALVAAVQTALGAGATVSAVSANGKQYLSIATVTAGPAGSVQATTAGTANTLLGMTDNSVESGTNQVNLGFGVTGKSSLGVLDLAGAQAALSVVNASGSAQSGAIAFTGLTAAGGQTQALTLSANDSTGAMQSITITLAATGNGTPALANDGSGNSIDSAVTYINSQLQKSNNSTLQQIVAVKEVVDGQEEVNFISSKSAFQLGIGSSTGSQGLNNGTAESVAGAQVGSGSTLAIDSQASAQTAITALAAAVGKLGSAQAAIGRGENQLSYAINLASSQITNFSAAESQIRDANVAQQAANLSKAQVLSQASIAAMAQANSAPQAVLALLRG